MQNLKDLYQQVIIDHNKTPRNYGRISDADRTAVGDNPLCGDHIEIDLLLNADGTVGEIKFEGNGCAICKSSTSLMTQVVAGKSIAEIEALSHDFVEMATATDLHEPTKSSLGKLAVFAGVREFPSRVKCATLSWHTVVAALKGQREASTEE